MLPFQLSAGPSAGEGRWAPPHQEPRAGLFVVAPGHPGAGSSLALSGLGAGWQFRFLRRLAGPGLGEPELAPRAARRAHTEGQGRAAWLVARHAPGRRGAGPGGTGFPRLLGAAARGLAAQGPLCGGPSSCADPSQRTIAQCCRPPGQALQAAPRPPKAREPGGAFL